MEGTTDPYHCVATRKDGIVDQFCARTFNDFPESRKAAAVEDITLDGVTVYPTQVAAGGKVTVCKAFVGYVSLPEPYSYSKDCSTLNNRTVYPSIGMKCPPLLGTQINDKMVNN